MDNPLSDAGEQLFELGQDTGKKFVKDVVKGVPKAAKTQIVGSNASHNSNMSNTSNLSDVGNLEKIAADAKKKIDPVTGKPIPSKVMLTTLQQATAKLQLMKLQKVREELEKQRLKVSGQQTAAGGQEKGPQIQVGQAGAGPEMPVEKPKPKDDSVQQMLKKSQGTSEFKGGVDG